MAVLSKEQFFTRLHERVGSDTSDEAISFLEDMSDTFNSMERDAAGDGVNWKQKYTELDNAWKERYRHRFFNGGSSYIPAQDSEPEIERSETISVNDLFTKKG